MTKTVPGFLLQQVLLDPACALQLSTEQSNLLISQARIARLLATLAMELDRQGVLTELPQRIRRHFDSAVLVHEKQKRDLEYDCESIRHALATVGEKLVLLKGGAYLQSGLPVGRGRLITDIDIIVPHHRISEAEQALNAHDWESSQLDEYNEAYYRKWSHETPALVNRKRGTTLDLHHNILPPTAGPNVNASLLFEQLVAVKPGVYTLCLPDMVIHSATHLFHEGEFHHGLRDLWDLDRMLRDFPTRDPFFWDRLSTRASELDLTGSLFHGLRYAQLVFATPIPAATLNQAGSRSRSLRQPLMDFLFLRAFRPAHTRCRLPFTGLALNLLYLRSHYLRMPLYLLLPHLVTKAWMRRKTKDPQDDD